MLRGKIVRLREILVDVVELPHGLVRIPFLADRIPRHERRRRGHPALVIEAAVAAKLEILRVSWRRRAGIGECRGEAPAFDRLLLDTVEHAGRGDAAELV